VAYDKFTGLQLPAYSLKTAQLAELEFLNQLGTWQGVARTQVADEGYRVLCVKWVECNKGEAEHPNMHARLLAQGTMFVSPIAAGDVESTFAATPPLEALRFLSSWVTTLPSPPGDDWVLVFIDISRAHHQCKVLRQIFCEPPAEANMAANMWRCWACS